MEPTPEAQEKAVVQILPPTEVEPEVLMEAQQDLFENQELLHQPACSSDLEAGTFLEI